LFKITVFLFDFIFLLLLKYYFCADLRQVMAKKKIIIPLKRNSPRIHKHLFILNEEENNALNRYISKYKVLNKSKFIRETLMIAIIRKFEEDHPTLFD